MTDETPELLLCPECDKERAFSCGKSFCGYEEGLQEKLRTVVSERDAALSRVERLEGVLRYFLQDERFDVAAGGNHDAVEEMISDALAVLSPPVESEYPPEQMA